MAVHWPLALVRKHLPHLSSDCPHAGVYRTYIGSCPHLTPVHHVLHTRPRWRVLQVHRQLGCVDVAGTVPRQCRQDVEAQAGLQGAETALEPGHRALGGEELMQAQEGEGLQVGGKRRRRGGTGWAAGGMYGDYPVSVQGNPSSSACSYTHLVGAQ